MKKLLLITILTALSTPPLLGMEYQGEDLDNAPVSLISFPNPEAGLIICIDDATITSIKNPTESAEKRLNDNDFYAIEHWVGLKKLDDEIALLLTEQHPPYTYIGIKTDTIDSEVLASLYKNRYVKNIFYYKNQIEKIQLITRHFDRNQNNSQRWACLIGCSSGAAVTLTLGTLITLALSLNS